MPRLSDKSASAARKTALDRLLSVFAETKNGEGTSALLLTLSVFLLLTSYYLLKTAREPLILGSGAEIKSYSSAGQALLLIPTTYLYGKLASHVGRIRLITFVTLFFAANLFIFFGLHALHVKIGVPFFLWVGVFNVMIVAQFWSFASDVYTEEQGKRLFAILGVGGTLGAVVGAAFAGLLIRPIGIYGLLLVAVVFLLASLTMTHIVHHREEARGIIKAGHEEDDHAAHGAADKNAPLAGKNGFALILQDRYLLLVAALLFILNCVNTNGEYILDRALVAHLKATIPAGVDATKWTGEHIGVFKAQYFFYVNTATVILQLFAVSRVIKYFGVRAGLILSPVVSLVGYSTAFFAPALGIIFAVKICENTLDYSLQNTAKQALWLLTSRDEKYKAKSICDSFVVRSGDFVSAAITFGGTALAFTTRHFILVNTGLVGVWVVIVVLLAHRHKRREARLGKGGGREAAKEREQPEQKKPAGVRVPGLAT